MKWTALWSLMLTGAMLTSCGGESGGGGQVSSDRKSAAPAIEVSTNGACTPLNSFFSELRNLTNAARAEKGTAPLSFSLQLGKSAQDYAEDLATQNFFSHNGKDGSTFSSRIKATGYTGSKVGENLVAGSYTAQEAFSDWMDSDSHRNNLLSPAFTEVGFGMYDTTGDSNYGRYWVQHLGSGNSQGGIYIPDDCGSVTLTTADASPDKAVAGVSNLDTERQGSPQDAQPETAYGGEGLTLPGNGSIPVGSLAFAVADSTRNGGNQEIPEPALLLGLGGLGLAILRDRKVAARKASALAIDSGNFEANNDTEAGTVSDIGPV